MKRAIFAPLSLVGLVAALGPGCSSGFGRIGPNASLVVTITAGDLGKPEARLPIPFARLAAYTVDVEAHKADGTIDTSFNGYVRASVKPGTVGAVTGTTSSGRNVQLVNGVARGVVVNVGAAYGDARIWFDDVGYAPADILRNPPPQCSDGIDNNGNGLIDFPADPGCAFANDDTEDGGTFATGISQPIYFRVPRIADVRGRSVDAMGTPTGGATTNFPHDQVQIDTGWRGGDYAFSTIVTRVSADGFYVTDLQQDLAGSDPSKLPDPSKVSGFASVFAFTFSTPPKMRVCDRLKLFGGTASDFHGFTEVGFPTWLLEEWDPTQRDCLVPEPHSISPGDLASPEAMFRLESSMVRIETTGTGGGQWDLHVAKHFGPGVAQQAADGSFSFTDAASSCDLNHDGKISFDGGPENVCSVYCNGGTDPRDPTGMKSIPPDPECSEYSQFSSQNDFMLVIAYHFDAMNPANVQNLKMQVDGSASAGFDPLALKGQAVRAFTGTLRYFSGGSQFTLEARCEDDIVVTGSPQSSTTACVHARSVSDNNEGSH